MTREVMLMALEALELAQDNLRPHGDNCFLHDDGEYNRCFCGKDSLSDHLQSVIESLDTALRQAIEQQPADEPVANASAWFALVMNAAAELEDASHCLRDEDAKRTAISGAKHYRDAAKALYTRPQEFVCSTGLCHYKAKSDERLMKMPDEPVAWMWYVNNGAGYVSRGIGFHQTDIPFAKHTPLYTRPQPAAWVDLTDEEILEASRDHYNPHQRAEVSFARAIEAKLKEKNQ